MKLFTWALGLLLVLPLYSTHLETLQQQLIELEQRWQQEQASAELKHFADTEIYFEHLERQKKLLAEYDRIGEAIDKALIEKAYQDFVTVTQTIVPGLNIKPKAKTTTLAPIDKRIAELYQQNQYSRAQGIDNDAGLAERTKDEKFDKFSAIYLLDEIRNYYRALESLTNFTHTLSLKQALKRTMSGAQRRIERQIGQYFLDPYSQHRGGLWRRPRNALMRHLMPPPESVFQTVKPILLRGLSQREQQLKVQGLNKIPDLSNRTENQADVNILIPTHNSAADLALLLSHLDVPGLLDLTKIAGWKADGFTKTEIDLIRSHPQFRFVDEHPMQLVPDIYHRITATVDETKASPYQDIHRRIKANPHLKAQNIVLFSEGVYPFGLNYMVRPFSGGSIRGIPYQLLKGLKKLDPLKINIVPISVVGDYSLRNDPFTRTSLTRNTISITIHDPIPHETVSAIYEHDPKDKKKIIETYIRSLWIQTLWEQNQRHTDITLGVPKLEIISSELDRLQKTPLSVCREYLSKR